MKTKTLITVAAILILTASLPLFSQEKKPELSGTLHAACIIKVDAARNILPGNEAMMIQYILSSSNIGGKIAKDILGVTLGPGTWDFLTVETISHSSSLPNVSTYMFRLYVDFSNFPKDLGLKPVAEEFLDALVHALRNSLEKSNDDYMEIYRHQEDFAAENAQKAEVELRALQEGLRKISGPRNLSREAILKDISSLTEELRNTKPRMSMFHARRGNLEQQIAEIQRKVEEQIKSSPILDDMKKIVDIEANRLDKIRKLVEKSQLSEENLFDAQSKLARARVELAQKEQEIKDAAGGLRISQLMEELNNINLMQAETEEKIQDLDKQLFETDMLMKSADDYDIVALKVNAARNFLEQTLGKLNEIKIGFNPIRPVVTIVGSE